MEKEEEISGKGLDQSGNTSGNSDHENNKDLQARLSNDSDSVQILQFTDSIFVADTAEDDDSMMIPPTPDIIIPSTQEFACDEKNESVLSVNETCTEELIKEPKKQDTVALGDDEDDIMNDMTQDIPELDETQQILPADKQTSEKTSDYNPDDEDDEWQLKFTETQETQELESTVRMREAIEQEKNSSNRESAEKNDDFLFEDHHKQTPQKQDANDHISNKSDDNMFEKDIESEDEIEPSQSCLLDYQKSSTYNAFRDELLQSSINARYPENTPEVQKNGNLPTIDFSDVQLISSSPKNETHTRLSPEPIIKEDQPKESIHTIDIMSEEENKPKVDSDIVEVTSDKLINEPLLTKADAWVVGDRENINENSSTMPDLEKEESKNSTVSELGDPKNVTVSELIDSKEVPEIDLSNSKDVPVIDLGDSKDISFHNDPKEVSDHSNSKDVSVIDLADSKDESDRSDPKNVSSDSGDQKAITVSDLVDDPKDVTVSDLGDQKDITMSDLGDDPKDATLSDLVGSKNTTGSNLDESKITTDKTAKNESTENIEESVVTKQSGIEKIVHITPSDDSKSKRAKILNFECALVGDVRTSTPYEDKEIDTSSQPKDEATEKKVEQTDKIDHPKIAEQNSSEHEVDNTNLSPIVDLDKTAETAPQSMKPILQQRLRLSRNKQKVQFQEDKKPIQVCMPFERQDTQMKVIGSFKDTKSMEKIFKSYGITLESKYSEAILNLKPQEEFKIAKILSFCIKDNKVYLEESIQPIFTGVQKHDLATSPHSSSGSGSLTTTSNSASLHSGEIADISGSSSSAKSGGSSGIQLDTTVQSMPFSSQESSQKTSTQNSDHPNDFSNFFVQKKEDQDTNETAVETSISPIKSKSTKGKKKAAATNRKRAAETSNSLESNKNGARRKRGRFVKEEPPTEETSTDKGCLTTDEAKPRKATRGRRKNGVKQPSKEPPPKSEYQEIEIPENEEDSPAGTIIPGVRVMARWSDGFYYPGVVQSQESEGRWSIRFDDGNVKTINQEGLIKVSVMQPGTSILVQNNDNYFDPGIICGHFREGNKVGYEVELDSGITKRFSRTDVILSTDQAKLIISSLPPTTPATMTINLDNIIDGKRKRKSFQSSDPAPPAKKSPRISRRTAKVDPHVDTSAESSVETTEVPEASKPSKSSKSNASEEESSRTGRRATRKRKAAVTATEKAKILSKKNPKLFKDYAFLLTNADRKPVPKPPVAETSDSEASTEEETVVPFDKDELMLYIVSRGGTVLDKFDDIKKCTKKHIYLLANIYLRTMKYIQCMAAGIPCIKHHWVNDCCTVGEILNIKNYILPAGISLITNEVVEWHGKTDVLKGLKISLVSAPGRTFADSWAPVLLAAKAEFVQKALPSSKSGASAYVDLFITNSVCPQDVINAAKRKKIPIVSIEWLIQSLIAGKCLPYDAHPKFKHDYTE